jgi:hypothetical protein
LTEVEPTPQNARRPTKPQYKYQLTGGRIAFVTTERPNDRRIARPNTRTPSETRDDTTLVLGFHRLVSGFRERSSHLTERPNTRPNNQTTKQPKLQTTEARLGKLSILSARSVAFLPLSCPAILPCYLAALSCRAILPRKTCFRLSLRLTGEGRTLPLSNVLPTLERFAHA